MNNNLFIPSSQIIELFNILNLSDIDYVLLRNLDNELPNNLKLTKDIDILVKPAHKFRLISILCQNNWLKSIHPWNFGNNFQFLYSMDEFLFFNKQQVYLDVCFQLCCRSLNAGEWFPLDELIQESTFRNKRLVQKDIRTYMLSYEDELIHLITRCIFDKKIFNNSYIRRIEYLLEKVDVELFLTKLEKVFFKFSRQLFQFLKAKKYYAIRHNYITFINY
jgi:hypothetical protein